MTCSQLQVKPTNLNLTLLVVTLTSSAGHAGPVSVIQPCLSAQDGMKASMAIRLEDLARHYNQMADALRETERSLESDIFSEEDIKGNYRFL